MVNGSSSHRAVPGSCDIYRAHVDGSHLERLVADAAYNDQAALWPDGESLAFVSSRGSNADIWILDLKNHRVRNRIKVSRGDLRPSWSPRRQMARVFVRPRLA